jgi:hypothetical protein
VLIVRLIIGSVSRLIPQRRGWYSDCL